MVSSEIIELRPDLTYEKELEKILAQEVKELRSKRIPLVKVLWRNHKTEEATWESKETMRQQYPQLFNERNFEDEILLRGESFNTQKYT